MQAAWNQNWSDELTQTIVRWRYYDRPQGNTWVACDGEECVGLVDSMPRPHMLDGERITVRETGDWFCLPKYRIGIGLGLLRRVMDMGDPMLVIGGSRTTLDVLPKFRFQKPPPARYYIRPVTMRGLAANLIRQKWWEKERLAQMVPTMRVLWQRRCAAPSGGDMRLMEPDDVIPVPDGHGLVQIIEPAHWRWLLAMPRQLATPIGLVFLVDGKIVGCSISQLEPSAIDLDGRIIHLQFADAQIGKWITTMTVGFLANCGVGFIRCCVSTPDKFAVLEGTGFLRTQQAPVHWYSRHTPLPSVVDAGYLRGDDAMPFQALRGRRLKERHV